jgi:hypothetical protein
LAETGPPPRRFAPLWRATFACIHERRLVAQICPRWNRLEPWFELVGAFKEDAA